MPYLRSHIALPHHHHVAFVLLLVGALLVISTGCKEEEPPPPSDPPMLSAPEVTCGSPSEAQLAKLRLECEGTAEERSEELLRANHCRGQGGVPGRPACP